MLTTPYRRLRPPMPKQCHTYNADSYGQPSSADTWEISSSAPGPLRGDVAKWSKAGVCKTPIRRFESDRRLQTLFP